MKAYFTFLKLYLLPLFTSKKYTHQLIHLHLAIVCFPPHQNQNVWYWSKTFVSEILLFYKYAEVKYFQPTEFLLTFSHEQSFPSISDKYADCISLRK